jgi:hypothetical protein
LAWYAKFDLDCRASIFWSVQSYLYRLCDVVIGGYISSWVGTIGKQNLNLQIALELIFFWKTFMKKERKKKKSIS